MFDDDGEELPPKFCVQCGDPIPPGPQALCDDCWGFAHVVPDDEEEDPWPDDLDD